jgi:Homeobox KN domain
MSWHPHHISDISFTSHCSGHWHDWFDDQAYGFELSTSENFTYEFTSIDAQLQPDELGVFGFHADVTTDSSFSALESDYGHNALQHAHHIIPVWLQSAPDEQSLFAGPQNSLELTNDSPLTGNWLTSPVFDGKEFNSCEASSAKLPSTTIAPPTGTCVIPFHHDKLGRANYVRIKDLELDITPSSFSKAVDTGSSIDYGATSPLTLYSLPVGPQVQGNSIETTKGSEQLTFNTKLGQKDTLGPHDKPHQSSGNTKRAETLNFTQPNPLSSMIKTSCPGITAKSAPGEGVGRELLKEWFNAHRNFPYPTCEEESSFMSSTGLTLRQIRTYFANQRARNTRGGSLHLDKSSREMLTTYPAINQSSNFRITRFDNPSAADLSSALPGVFRKFSCDKDTLKPIENSGLLPSEGPPLFPFSASGQYGSNPGNAEAVNEEFSTLTFSNALNLSTSHCPTVGRKGKKRFAPSSSLLEIQSTAEDTNSYYCTFCVKQLKGRYEWKRHEATHVVAIRWTCMPNNKAVIQNKCVFCQAHCPSLEHLEELSIQIGFPYPRLTISAAYSRIFHNSASYPYHLSQLPIPTSYIYRGPRATFNR